MLILNSFNLREVASGSIEDTTSKALSYIHKIHTLLYFVSSGK